MMRMLGSGFGSSVGAVPESAALEAEGGFEGFFRTHHRRLFQAMYLLTGNRTEAEDLAQEAMVRVLQRWDRVGRMERPEGYLDRTALNLHRSGLRRLARWARMSAPPNPVKDPIDEAEARLEVHRALDALTRQQREALVLVEWVGLSAQEAGQLLGIQPVSIRSRVHRARETLQGELGGIDG